MVGANLQLGCYGTCSPSYTNNTTPALPAHFNQEESQGWDTFQIEIQNMSRVSSQWFSTIASHSTQSTSSWRTHSRDARGTKSWIFHSLFVSWTPALAWSSWTQTNVVGHLEESPTIHSSALYQHRVNPKEAGWWEGSAFPSTDWHISAEEWGVYRALTLGPAARSRCCNLKEL